MAGLLDAIRKGGFTADQHVVYLHTGGLRRCSPCAAISPNRFYG